MWYDDGQEQISSSGKHGLFKVQSRIVLQDVWKLDILNSSHELSDLHNRLCELPLSYVLTDFQQVLKGTGPVGQVRTLPEILLVYRAHLETTVHRISAIDTMCKEVQKTVQGLNAQLKFEHHYSVPCGGMKHLCLYSSPIWLTHITECKCMKRKKEI
jgi:hypothetical protein